jgi:hypothetical protein
MSREQMINDRLIATGSMDHKRKQSRAILFAAVVSVLLAAAVGEFGRIFEYEYPFWPTLWVAEQTKAPGGTRMFDLIRVRSGSSYVEQHWHHCTWCDVVYPHAPHMAVKVTVNHDEEDFYLFDWQLSQRKLLPITVRTAKAFPELIPPGCVAEPIGTGLNPQLYHNDEPCLIIPKSVSMDTESTTNS